MKKIFSLLSIIIILLSSCEDGEINLGTPPILENQPNFQVDFDGQTYKADYVEASVVNGVTTLKATKTSTNEIVLINLNRTEVGMYTFSPNNNVGNVAYKKDADDIFYTLPTTFSGRVDLTQIDLQLEQLFGTFSFIGTRIVAILDDQGQPVLDDQGNPAYNEEIKNFTNGLFSNIDYSSTTVVNPNIGADPEPDGDQFFMKIDGVEFEETTLNAEKIVVDGIEVIQIRATNDGSNHVFKLQMPADVIFGSSHTLQTTTTNPTSESTSTYRIISTSFEYGAFGGGTTAPTLNIITHDSNTNKLVGTFEYTGERLNGGTETIEITEGSFSLTYTE